MSENKKSLQKERDDTLHARIKSMGGYAVVVTKGRSPFAEVVEEIPCVDRTTAENTLRRVKKEIGEWY